MRRKNNSQKIAILIICLAISILGIYMTFFRDKDAESEVKEPIMEIEDTQEVGGNSVQETHDYTQKELPAEENISEDELINDGTVTGDADIYFTNTEMLDKSSMPLEAQAVLTGEVWQFLKRRGYEDITELYIDDEKFIEDEEHISFECFMDGSTEKLQIEYLFNESMLKYYILE